MTSTLRDAVSPHLRTTLLALKLGQMLATCPTGSLWPGSRR